MDGGGVVVKQLTRPNACMWLVPLNKTTPADRGGRSMTHKMRPTSTEMKAIWPKTKWEMRKGDYRIANRRQVLLVVRTRHETIQLART